MSESSATLRMLAGVWSATRVVVDHRVGTAYRFAGVIQLTEDTFRETGELQHSTGAVSASRVYRLQGRETCVDVLFPDGRPFVTLGLQASQTVRHDCGNDLYLGQLFFRNANAWTEYWRVAGPTKRYSSLGRYRRLADA